MFTCNTYAVKFRFASRIRSVLEDYVLPLPVLYVIFTACIKIRICANIDKPVPTLLNAAVKRTICILS